MKFNQKIHNNNRTDKRIIGVELNNNVVVLNSVAPETVTDAVEDVYGGVVGSGEIGLAVDDRAPDNDVDCSL